jgi:phosphonate transport system substrate-binding protein
MVARVGLLALLGVALTSFLACDKSDVQRVDFDDVIAHDSGIDVSSRPTLRVAVAAMISPSLTRKSYDALLDLVGERLGRRTVFIQRKTYAEVNDLLERKELDIAFVCSGPYVKGHREFGMELLVVPVVHGRKTYHSYILVHQDSELTCLAELRGKRFAFTDPESNTGCLVPRYMLSQRGETPESFFGNTWFTHSHDNSIKAVVEQLADGAAVDSLIWEFLNVVEPKFTKRTKIIEKSPPYGIPPVVVHPELAAGMKTRLREVFLTLHDDTHGEHILRHLQIDRFEEGDDTAYESIREMQARCREKKERLE